MTPNLMFVLNSFQKSSYFSASIFLIMSNTFLTSFFLITCKKSILLSCLNYAAYKSQKNDKLKLLDLVGADCSQDSHFKAFLIVRWEWYEHFEQTFLQNARTFKSLCCCKFSRETFSGRSSLSTIPRINDRYFGIMSWKSSVINTRRT